MRPRSCRAPAAGPARKTSRASGHGQRQSEADVADVARCPRCRAPLVARMGCRGPYFHCACAESVSPHCQR
jgi:hypothetical protein